MKACTKKSPETATQENSLQLQEASQAQRKSILALLKANKLPVTDITEKVKLYALTRNGQVLGSAGLEIWGTKALLRSVSVADEGKGKGWGKFITLEIEEFARIEGIDELLLVTTTAEGFFRKLGYSSIHRQEVPEAVTSSAQFSGICPASAAIMKKTLL